MSQHFEWTILGPDGKQIDGTYSMGPFGPKAVIADGGHLVQQLADDYDQSPVYDEKGEPVMVLRDRIPEGSVVGRRVVTYGDWEPCDDDQLSPRSGDTR